jgi:predicted PurR-regulated permease PerM
VATPLQAGPQLVRAKSPARAKSSGSDILFRRRLLLTVFTVAGVAALFFGIWMAAQAVLLIYISTLLAIGLSPIVRWIERGGTTNGARRVRRWQATLVIYVLFITLVGLIAWLVLPPVLSQAGELRQALPQLLTKVQAGLVHRGILPHAVTLEEAVRPAPGEPAPLLATAAGTLWGVLGGVFGLVTILFLTFYLLIEGASIFQYFVRFVPASKRSHVTAVARDVVIRLSAWLRANVILGGIMGVVSGVGLALLGEPYPYVIALIAALGEMVPMAGPLIAGVIAVAVASTVSATLAVAVAIFFLIVHEVEANILVPKIMQHHVGVSSVAIVIGLLIGAEWLGVVGVVLAIPTTAIVAAILDQVLQTRQATAAGAAKTSVSS